MRVLLDASAVPARPVGAGVYVTNLARALTSISTVDLHLAVRVDDARRWWSYAPGATVHAVVPPSRPARLLWEQWGASALAAEVRPDVWHGPHYTLPLRLRAPGVVTMHDTTFLEHPEWHERTKVAYFRPMMRAATRRARAVVAVSDTTAQRLARLVPLDRPCFVAAHGVDHERFHPRSNDDDLTCVRHIGARPPFVAFAATLEPRKDVPTLVDAFARLAGDRPDLRLVLAGGDGWGAGAVRAAVEASGVATRVLRPGYVADDVVPALFRTAEVVAYPSLDEGFGLPALEALACGAPLVTTSGTAMAEVAGDAAVLVAPGDPGALAGALASVVDHPDRAAALRAAGPARAATFTWEASARVHLAAYEEAAGSSAA